MSPVICKSSLGAAPIPTLPVNVAAPANNECEPVPAAEPIVKESSVKNKTPALFAALLICK